VTVPQRAPVTEEVDVIYTARSDNGSSFTGSQPSGKASGLSRPPRERSTCAISATRP